jgi:hypothetical protein
LQIKGEQPLILVMLELSHEKYQRDQAHTERTIRRADRVARYTQSFSESRAATGKR